MTPTQITQDLSLHYGNFEQYIRTLSEADYSFAPEGKWNAGQVLEHLVLCVKPLVQVYGMPAEQVEAMFGREVRANRSYQEIHDGYYVQLNKGGKAPNRFEPPASPFADRDKHLEALANLISQLNALIARMPESDLESLLVPHPLLGKLTLKEMLYNAIHHVQHHQAQVAGYFG